MSASAQPEPGSDGNEVPATDGGDPEGPEPDDLEPENGAIPGSGPARSGKARHRTALVAAATAGALALYYIANFGQVWAASRTVYRPPGTDVASLQRAAIVLGAAQYNGEPSPVLQARLDEAAHLYESGDVGLIVVTGGGQAADVTTEAKTGYDYLRESSGVPDQRLRLEVQGGSTYESLAASSRFLRAEGVLEVVLVTDRYHAKRSMLIAQEVGMTPTVSLTPYAPSLDRLAREAAAVSVGRLISFRRLEQL